MMGKMRIRELQTDQEHLWDRYVLQAPEALFFHLSGWQRVIEQTYGHSTRFLMVEEDGEIRGVAPLFIVKNRWFGTNVRSLPGGICADERRHGQALLDAAIALTETEGADFLTLRDARRFWDGDLITSQLHCNQSLALPAESQQLWTDLPSKVRNRVKKARKSGLVTIIGGAEEIPALYHVLSHNWRDLGTPIFDQRLVYNVMSQFPQQTRILVVRRENQPIGAMFMLLFRDVVSTPWMGSLRHFFRCCPNDLMFWEAMCWACDCGFRHFDLGRAEWGSGPSHFKAKWGADLQPLYFQYFLRRGTHLPDLSLKAQRVWTYRSIIWLWQRLPVSITRAIGPRLRKYINPWG